MGTSKAFVFSLDSFVAFVLTVAALYSLLFFSTVPSAYYTSLMQANYLAKDTLLTLATTFVEDDTVPYCDSSVGESYLSCIIAGTHAAAHEGINNNDEDEDAARIYIGSEGPEGIYEESALVPAQFGYKLEYMHFDVDDLGEIDFDEGDWVELYNTAKDPDSANKKEYNKLKAAAHALYFGYDDYPEGGEESPLHYMNCDGPYTICAWSDPFAYYGGDDEYGENQDIVGDAYSYIVRLTVYT
ncbi:MAG: hypothetical protein GY852_04700 [bacterium]|nr:hypothetical protein [bacterium]